MPGPFTAHNIRLDDGTETKPDARYRMIDDPRFLAARRWLRVLFPGGFGRLRLADLGCLEGGYTVEFARLGFGEALGIEVRGTNFANCLYVKERVDLPNLAFVQDDVWNLDAYGTFDVMFCGGLLYHLDRPRAFLSRMANATRTTAIIETHYATVQPIAEYSLSEIATHEGLPGRWFTEPRPHSEETRWAAWDNDRSFWIQKEYLIQAIRDAGFPMVFEQYDNLGQDIAASMTGGPHKLINRSMFVGVKVDDRP